MTVISARRTGALLLRQYYLIRGSVARLVPLFIWVTIDMVLWGFITKYLNTISGAGIDFVPRLLGAVLLWDFFTRVMQGVTLAFFEDVWSRNFLNLFASPLSIAEYVTGLMLSTIATSAIGLVVMLVLAVVVFGLSFFAFGIALLPFLLTLFLFGIALGIVACAMVLRLGPAAEWFVWPIPGLISPFVGVFYPLSTLPRWMQWVGYTMPPTYVFEGMRAIVAGGQGSGPLLLWSVILATAYLGAAGWLFARVYRHAVRTGLITRYSAETLT